MLKNWVREAGSFATCEYCDDSRIATYGTFEYFKVFLSLENMPLLKTD